MFHQLGNGFGATITSETTINAVTKTNFEKVGVVPNIKTNSEEIYSTGYRLALQHLKKNNPSIHPSNYDKILDFISINNNSNKEDLVVYQKYIGRYKGTIAEIIISLKGKNLYAEIVGKGGKIKLISKGNHTFLVNGEKERIKFIVNKKNEVIKLIGVDSPMDLKKIKDSH